MGYRTSVARSLLWEWLVQRGDDLRAFFRTRTRLFFLGKLRPRGNRLRLFERLACSQPLDLLGVERFAREQRVGNRHQRRLVFAEQLMRVLVIRGDDALHFLIDLQRRILAVILVLRDLAAEEDLLFFLAERERAHRV